MKSFNKRAIQLKKDFEALRDEMTVFANANKRLVDRLDKTALRKLFNFPADITPSRLVTLSTKILNDKKGL